MRFGTTNEKTLVSSQQRLSDHSNARWGKASEDQFPDADLLKTILLKEIMSYFVWNNSFEKWSE
jgi:hypothetical protein